MTINCRPSFRSNSDLFMTIREEIYMGLMLIRMTQRIVGSTGHFEKVWGCTPLVETICETIHITSVTVHQCKMPILHFTLHEVTWSGSNAGFLWLVCDIKDQTAPFLKSSDQDNRNCIPVQCSSEPKFVRPVWWFLVYFNKCPQCVTFPNQVTVKYFKNNLMFLKNSSFTMILGISVLNEPAAST
jgi:hypothetical protein